MLSTNLQNPIDFNGQKFYVGLDVHKKSWAVTIRSLGIERESHMATAFSSCCHLICYCPDQRLMSGPGCGCPTRCRADRK